MLIRRRVMRRSRKAQRDKRYIEGIHSTLIHGIIIIISQRIEKLLYLNTFSISFNIYHNI